MYMCWFYSSYLKFFNFMCTNCDNSCRFTENNDILDTANSSTANSSQIPTGAKPRYTQAQQNKNTCSLCARKQIQVINTSTISVACQVEITWGPLFIIPFSYSICQSHWSVWVSISVMTVIRDLCTKRQTNKGQKRHNSCWQIIESLPRSAALREAEMKSAVFWLARDEL